MVKPLRSLIQEKFPLELRVEIEMLSRRHAETSEKQEAFLELLRKYDIKNVIQLGPGTNRYAIKIDGFVVKVATDHDGKIDNMKEFKMAPILYPYVSKIYEVSENGTLLVAEYIQPFTEFSEMISHAERIRAILSKLSDRYLIGDVGISEINFANWGLRVGTNDPVCLDFAYVYEISSELFLCRECKTTMLVPDKDFKELYCPNPACGKKYRFEDIRRRIGNDIHRHEIGDLTEEGYRITESGESVELSPNKSPYLLKKRKPKHVKKAVEQETPSVEDNFIMKHSPEYYRQNHKEDMFMDNYSKAAGVASVLSKYHFDENGELVLHAIPITASRQTAPEAQSAETTVHDEQPEDTTVQTEEKETHLAFSADVPDEEEVETEDSNTDDGEDSDGDGFWDMLAKVGLEKAPEPTEEAEFLDLVTNTIRTVIPSIALETEDDVGFTKTLEMCNRRIKRILSDALSYKESPVVEARVISAVEDEELKTAADVPTVVEEKHVESKPIVADEKPAEVRKPHISANFRENIRRALSKFSDRIETDMRDCDLYEECKPGIHGKRMTPMEFYTICQNAVFNSLTSFFEMEKHVDTTSEEARNSKTGRIITWDPPRNPEESKAYPTLVFLDRYWMNRSINNIESSEKARERYRNIFSDYDGIQREWVEFYRSRLKEKLRADPYVIDMIVDFVVDLWVEEEPEVAESETVEPETAEAEVLAAEESSTEENAVGDASDGDIEINIPQDGIKVMPPEEQKNVFPESQIEESMDMVSKWIADVPDEEEEEETCECCHEDHDHNEEEEDGGEDVDYLKIIVTPAAVDGDVDTITIMGDATNGVIQQQFFVDLDEVPSDKQPVYVGSQLNGEYEWLVHMRPDVLFIVKDYQKWLDYNALTEEEDYQVHNVILDVLTYADGTESYLMGLYCYEGIYYEQGDELVPCDDPEIAKKIYWLICDELSSSSSSYLIKSQRMSKLPPEYRDTEFRTEEEMILSVGNEYERIKQKRAELKNIEEENEEMATADESTGSSAEELEKAAIQAVMGSAPVEESSAEPTTDVSAAATDPSQPVSDGPKLYKPIHRKKQ